MTRYIIAALIPIPTKIELVLMIVLYRLRRNAASYASFKKSKFKLLCSL